MKLKPSTQKSNLAALHIFIRFNMHYSDNELLCRNVTKVVKSLPVDPYNRWQSSPAIGSTRWGSRYL